MKKSEIIDGVIELMQDKSPAARGLAGRWVNYILNDLSSRALLPSLLREEWTSLVAGNGTSFAVGRDYELATDTDKICKVFIPSLSRTLTRKPAADFIERVMRDGATYQGEPEIYMVFGRTLRIHPVPDSTVAPADPGELERLYVWKYKDIAELTEGDEVIEIRPKHIPLIVIGAYSFGAHFDSAVDQANAVTRYEAGVRLFQFDQTIVLDGAKQVPYNDL